MPIKKRTLRTITLNPITVRQARIVTSAEDNERFTCAPDNWLSIRHSSAVDVMIDRFPVADRVLLDYLARQITYMTGVTRHNVMIPCIDIRLNSQGHQNGRPHRLYCLAFGTINISSSNSQYGSLIVFANVCNPEDLGINVSVDITELVTLAGIPNVKEYIRIINLNKPRTMAGNMVQKIQILESMGVR